MDVLTRLLGSPAADWRGRSIALLGSGGKTTLLQTLARLLSREIPRVLLSTSTKVYPVPGIPTVSAINELPAAFADSRAVFLGRQIGDEGKLAGLPSLTLADLTAAADCVLLEADGARRHPFKVHLPHDPTLPDGTDLAIILVGASAIGKAIGPETVHRFERAPAHWGLREGEPLSPALASRVLLGPDGYFGKTAGAPARVLINQVDAEPAAAASLAAELTRRWPGPVITGSARLAEFERVGAEEPGASLVVLAAGAGRRFGGDKRRLEIRGHALLEWTFRAYENARVLERVVVLGPGDESLAELATAAGFRAVVCANPEVGQSASLLTGLAAVSRGACGALIALGDMPALRPVTLGRLIEAIGVDPGRALRPIMEGAPGHPVYLPRAAFAELATLQGDHGARDLLPTLDPFHLECADPGVILDIDTGDQLAELKSQLPEEF